MAAILGDHLLQVVDAIEEDVVEIAHFGLDIPRHGDVDHEHRSMAAHLERPFDHALAEDRQLTGGGGDDDIGLLQCLGNGAELDRPGTAGFGQGLGPAQRAVGDGQAHDAGFAQMAGDQLDGLAGTDQQCTGPAEVIEDTTRQADRGIGHGNRVLADRGFGAHLLGDRERMLEQPLQLAAQPHVLARNLIGILELTENLRLAQHHGIEPRGDTHQMAGRFTLVIVIGATEQLLRRHAMEGAQPLEQLALAIGHRYAVELGAVAGRQHRGFAHVGQGPQLRQRGLELRRREGDTLAHVDRGGLVIDTQS